MKSNTDILQHQYSLVKASDLPLLDDEDDGDDFLLRSLFKSKLSPVVFTSGACVVFSC